jgi:SAM-dependent methyltransferase
MPRFDAAQIRRYYDRHTSAFVTFGQGGHVGAIHRAVWGPGVRTRVEAFRYVEHQIAEHLRHLVEATGVSAPHVVDLGCGVGSTLVGLSRRQTIRGTGITLSPVQVGIAEEQIRKAGLTDQIRCIEGDYCDLPADLGAADFVFAIESFAHGPDPARFFDECARIIRPGGLLIICDDFRRPASHPAGAHSIERFCRGWHINTLLERDQLRQAARGAGFHHETTDDLSPYLELRRPRDRALAVLVALFGWLPPVANRFDHLVGGSALHTCLTKGWIGYDLALFRRLG